MTSYPKSAIPVLLLPVLFNGIRVVLHIYVDPHQTGNAKNVDIVDDQKSNQQTKRGGLTPTQHPVKKHDEQQAEPPRPDVGNKHRSVIIARLRKIIQVTLRATLEHIDGFHKRPTARFERLPLVASRTFQVKNTVGFRAFFE